MNNSRRFSGTSNNHKEKQSSKDKYHGTLQTTSKKTAISKAKQTNQMGALLDRTKNLRQRKKGTPWKTHHRQTKLEKNQIKGLNHGTHLHHPPQKRIPESTRL